MSHDVDPSQRPARGYVTDDPTAQFPAVGRRVADDADPVGEGIGVEAWDATGPAPATGETLAVDDDAEPARATPASPPGTKQESVARASALMAAGSMVSRVLGLVRQSLLTSVVAAASAANAFAVANTLPNYVYMLLSAGILNAVLIPQITKAMKRDDGGQEFVDRIVTVSLALIAFTTLLATFFAPFLVRATSSYTAATYNLAVLFAYVCLPQIAFYGLYAVLGQVLNARNQFTAFMWAPVLANIVQIAGLVYFLFAWGQQDDAARWTQPMVWVLAGSTTLGIALQGLFLIIPLVRGGFRWRPRWGLRGSGLGAASRMAGWSFIALLVSIGGGLMVQKVLSYIEKHHASGHIVSVAGQQYAFLVFMIPHAFITTSVLTALFPRMSRAVHDADEPGLRRLIRQGLSMPATAVIPASIALAVLAIPVVKVMFSLPHHDAVVIGEALAIMALGTLPFGITTLQQRYCFAREDGWLNLWMQFIVTGGQIAFLGVALVAPAPQAILWAAAGQSVGNSVAALIWLFIARRQIGNYGLGYVVRLWTRLIAVSLVAGAAAGVAVWGLSRLLTTRIEQLVVLGVGGILFAAIFLVAAQLLRITEVDEFLNPIVRRLPIPRRR